MKIATWKGTQNLGDHFLNTVVGSPVVGRRVVSRPVLGLLVAIGLFAASLAYSTYAQAVQVGHGAQTPSKVLSITPELEKKIVHLYSDGHCNQLLELVTPQMVTQLRSNLIAVVASCEPPWADPEKLFQLAEEKTPNGDLIAILHAKYRWKVDPASSIELWKKVMEIARNESLRNMARAYISGSVESRANPPLNLSSTTYLGDASIGTSYERNPKNSNYPQFGTPGSTAANASLHLNAQHWYRWGSIAANYRLKTNQYFNPTANHEYSLLEQTLNFPFALNIGRAEDVVFYPLGSYTTLGGSIYSGLFGVGIIATIYRASYKQSVLGQVFHDYFDPSDQRQLAGSHYLFNYRWEFFPPHWWITGTVSIENVSANTSTSFAGVRGAFNNSHTDVGTQGSVQRDFKRLSLGLMSKLLLRTDSDSSTYADRTTGAPITKTRQDFTFSVQPSITLPLTSLIKLFAWYEWMNTSSNVGDHDYANRNLLNQTVGLALRTGMSSY